MEQLNKSVNNFNNSLELLVEAMNKFNIAFENIMQYPRLQLAISHLMNNISVNWN
jgi:hypothetical protein